VHRMSSLDAGFFFAENDRTPLQIASVSVFEGDPPSYGELVRLTLSKLDQLPKYRQRVRTVPFNLARPVWVDDPHFQVLYHVRRTAVPSPGGPGELRNLAGRILAQRLDLSRPLWESWLIEGLDGGRWAIVIKVHHCMVDGVGGSDLMALMFDQATAGTPAEPSPWAPEPEPSTLAMMRDGLRDTVADSIRRTASVPALMRRLASQETGDFVGALPRYVGQLSKGAAPSLNGPTSPHRRWSWVQADLGEIKGVRRALGGTVNDVILAAVAAGFRDLLHSRGVLSAESVVRTMVPVSTRAPGEQGMQTNRVSAVLVSLPCGEPDPVRRLHLVRQQMDFLKGSHQAIGPDALVRVLGMMPPVLATTVHTALLLRQPVIHTVTTTVPGPPFPLYVLGRKLVELYPYIPIATGFRVSIGNISYLGRLYFGLTGDFDAMPDLQVLAGGIRDGFGELAKEAGSTTPGVIHLPPPR
jgi:diacylglycerol O-acyltransferase / wax synthase